MQLTQRIAAKPWPHALVLALLVMVGSKFFLKLLWPEHFRIQYTWALGASVLLVRLLAEMPICWERMRAQLGAGASMTAQASALVPEELRGMAGYLAAQLRGAMLWLLRRPPCPPAPAGTVFGFYAKSQYPTLFMMVMLSCAVEIPIDAMVLELLEPDPVIRLRMRAMILTGLVCIVLGMIGDRPWLRGTAHVLDHDALHLRLGARLDGVIPLAAIQEAYRIKSRKELSQSKNAWLRQNGFDPEQTVIGSPYDLPNVVLVLDPSVPLVLHKFRIRRAGVRHLLLYVDDPSRMIAACGQAPPA
jgi:hypothetical protein